MINYIWEDIARLRWVILLLFAIGYSITASRFHFSAGEYLFYNLLALGACAVLLTQLKVFGQCFAAVWLGLIILVTVYFLRFYWIVIDPSPVKVMLPQNSYIEMLPQVDKLINAFKLSVIAFSAFSLSAAAMFFLLRKQDAATHRTEEHGEIASHWFIAKFILLLLPPLMLALAYIAHKYHIGEMGAAPGEPLPFRLKGVIFYARIVLLPLMILQFMYSAARSGHPVVARLGVLLLLTHGVIDMLIRGSRSSLLLCVLLLVFLLMARGIQLRRNEKIFIGITVILAIVMVPIMTEYRYWRVQHDFSVMDALNNAVGSVGIGWWGALMKGVEFVFFRMPGTESLWAMLSRGAEPLGMQSFDVFATKNGLAGYLTYQIHPMKVEDNTLLAPGFVGWFYLVAGIPAILLGSAAAAIFSILGWKYLSRDYLVCGPVAQTFLLWMFFVALTEGTLDSMVYMVLAGIVSIAAMEFSLRLSKKHYSVNGLHDQFS